MSDQKKISYPGERIDVEWDTRLCIHIGECGKSEGELFMAERKPWCDPDKIRVEHVVEIVERCPTGALTYQAKNGQISENAPEENNVLVSNNGPYFVSGDLDIDGIPEDMHGVAYRATLCRCGQSRNKPFCDNSHEESGFKDYGAIGQRGEATTQMGGKLSISQLEDGPLLLNGNVNLAAGSGRKAWQGNNVALCRCGASSNKPFCDGSHTEAGFKSG